MESNMNAKKAKALRRLAKANGVLKTEPDYRAKETKKMVYTLDKDGKPMAYEVKRQTIININRTAYQQMKKDYYNGDLAI